MVAPRKTKSYVPDRGDIVWLEFTPQVGGEQAGHRPALVISPKSYNGRVGLALFCPITSHVKGYPFEVVLKSGGKTEGAVLADQLKSLDWKARSARKIEAVCEGIIIEVLAKIDALVS